MNINEIVNFLWVFYIFLGILFIIQLDLFWKEIKKKTIKESEEIKDNKKIQKEIINSKKELEEDKLSLGIKEIKENYSKSLDDMENKNKKLLLEHPDNFERFNTNNSIDQFLKDLSTDKERWFRTDKNQLLNYLRRNSNWSNIIIEDEYKGFSVSDIINENEKLKEENIQLRTLVIELLRLSNLDQS